MELFTTPKGQHFIDLDVQVPPPVQLPAEPWVEVLNDAKDEFEVDGATAVFSTWRVEVEDPLDTGHMALDACMTDVRAAGLLRALPENESILKIKFLHEQNEGDWVVEDKFDPVRTERKKGQGIVKIT